MKKYFTEEERRKGIKEANKRAKIKYRSKPEVIEMERKKRLEYLSRPEIAAREKAKREDPEYREVLRKRSIDWYYNPENTERARARNRAYHKENADKRKGYLKNRPELVEKWKQSAKERTQTEEGRRNNYIWKKRYRDKADSKEKRRIWQKLYSERNAEKIKEYNRLRTESGRASALERVRRKKLRDEGVYRPYCAKGRAKIHGSYIDSDVVAHKTIFERDGWKCCYCKNSVVHCKNNAPNQATIDHFIPISKGGSHTYENMRTSCRSCNTKKNDKIPTSAQLTIFERV